MPVCARKWNPARARVTAASICHAQVPGCSRARRPKGVQRCRILAACVLEGRSQCGYAFFMLRQQAAPVMAWSSAAFLLLQSGKLLVAAQFPMPFNGTACDIYTLTERVTRINEACCVPAGEQQTCNEHPCDVGCVHLSRPSDGHLLLLPPGPGSPCCLPRPGGALLLNPC